MLPPNKKIVKHSIKWLDLLLSVATNSADF